ncbi:acyl carrier protein [Paenibacillus assamensis]|uniref:acyl carrier protein n=1 Tax=Paenibacillus assamensis TaxID=311244 RepID=UPI00040645A7|nr:acyl carrier protein [Paenibacillus assamensis]
MSNELISDVIDMLVEITDGQRDYSRVVLSSSLLELGIDSFEFVKLVVIIEAKYDIEFDDEDLNFKRFSTMHNLITFIDEKRKKVESDEKESMEERV